jgi:lipid-A-disaccharide synthase
MNQPVDIVILSNGPGELTTWVRPVVRALRQRLSGQWPQVRISLVLSPCPNASGREVAIARQFPEIHRIQAAKHFFPFLLWGKTAANWDWRDRGVVLFLGGDQFYTVVIGKRLGYRTVVYGEWETRWHHWIDQFGVMNETVVAKVPPRYQPKLNVIGDLMADVPVETAEADGEPGPDQELIGFLPGSKPFKLAQGVPMAVAIAHYLQTARPHSRFGIPVAPTLTPEALARFADPQYNPLVRNLPFSAAQLVWQDDQPFLQAASGLQIALHTQFPAYGVLAQCRLCLTTVGANTAELGAMAVPMLVLIPTQRMDAMRAWDGIPGILANLPGIGPLFARLINWWFLRKPRLLAWPNIWAGEMIVPELIGRLQPDHVAKLVLDYLEQPDKLQAMRDRLRQVRGKAGAADRLAELVIQRLIQG